MSLWQTNTYDESSESEDDGLRNDSEDLVEFSSPISTRETEKALRRETNSPLNRLKSIGYDSKFVQKIALQFPNLPVVANERCGRWYIPSHLYHSSAYFKSTDGHYGNWSFNTRRLNIEFLRTIVSCGGAILVDSTRRGKRMPDALSKTVPIWCAVINQVASKGEEWSKTYFPEGSVSAQEISSIESLIPSFVTSFKNCGFDIPSISILLNKPLRPLFITPESDINLLLSNEYYPVILLTASSLVPSGHKRIEGFVYVQGAADDEEAWAHRLTSPQFWDHDEKLLNCVQEGELVNEIQRIISDGMLVTMKEEVSRIGSTGIFLGVGTAIPEHATIICGSEDSSMQKNVLYLHIPRKAKPVTIMTQSLFPAAVSFTIKHGILTSSSISIVATESEKQVLDLSIAVALILLCLFFDDQGSVNDRRGQPMTKNIIRKRLTWIITARGHQAERLSRKTLKIVNTFLMSQE